MINFTVSIPPSVNDYLGKKVTYVKGKNGSQVPIVTLYKTTKAIRWTNYAKKKISVAVKEANWKKTGEFDYVVCDIDAYLPQKKMDCDNLLKCLLDAIKECEVVYDDCMIIPRFNEVFIDKDNPRLNIKISKSHKSGIFKNKKDFNIFKVLNCEKCKKYDTYGDRCSIIRNSLENRIQAELDLENLRCSKKKNKS